MQAISNALFGQTVASQFAAPIVRQPILNVSTKKVGGLRFVKVGRFCVSYCITKTYKAV
jgi:hypothetical protein